MTNSAHNVGKFTTTNTIVVMPDLIGSQLVKFNCVKQFQISTVKSPLAFQRTSLYCTLRFKIEIGDGETEAEGHSVWPIESFKHI